MAVFENMREWFDSIGDVPLYYYFIVPGALIILAEVIISVRRGENNYHWKDSAASAAMGVGATVLGALSKGSTIAVFAFVAALTKDLRIDFLGYEAIPRTVWWAWALAILADDLSFYWHHRFSHTIRVLWAAHVVHHSSVHYNLGTSFRNGWVIFMYKPISWFWMAAIGFDPIMIVTAMSINSLYQFTLHTTQVPHLGFLEWFANTPQLHQLHHSSNIAFLDKNHGGMLNIWDRLFGTYMDSRKHAEKRRFGVLTPPNSYNPLIIFAHEYLNIWKDVKRAPGLLNKLKYIFYPPGWSHDGSTLTAKQLHKLMQRGVPVEKLEHLAVLKEGADELAKNMGAADAPPAPKPAAQNAGPVEAR